MEKLPIRKGVVVLTIFASVLALTSAVFANGSSEKQTGSGGQVELNYVYRITSADHDKYIKWLTDTFDQMNQGKIHLNVTGIADKIYKSKIELQLAGAGAPDVFFSWEGGYAKAMVDSGYSAQLDSYFQKYGWDTSLTAAAKSIATIEGHQYCLPYVMDASLVWYNTDIFKKYNLGAPKTWDDMVNVAAVLKQNGIAPMLLANQQKWEAQFDWTAYFVNKNGAQTYADLLNRKIPWTDSRVVDAFAQLKKLADDGFFMQGLSSMDFSTTADQVWDAGRAAMWYQGSFILNYFLNADRTGLKSPVSFFPYPKFDGVTPTVEIFAEETDMINAHSKNKDAAAEFLNFVVSEQAQEQQTKVDVPFPVNKSVTLTGFPDMIKQIGKLIAGYTGSTWMHVDHALASNVAIPFLDSLSSVLTGQMTPEVAANTVEQAAQTALGPVVK